MSDVPENIEIIRAKIKIEAEKAGRNPAEVSLVAVSKKQPLERIEDALSAGQRLFGENRVQEAQKHWGALKQKQDYPDLKLHMIGPLQTNKVRDAVALFDCFETLDREKLARALADEMALQGRDLPCFIQVNTGKEPQKSGVLPDYIGEFYDFCRYECGLDIRGLMCIPPVDGAAALHFALLKKLAHQHDLNELSMGMSGDFEQAIMQGATLIRVGTALFGAREAKM